MATPTAASVIAITGTKLSDAIVDSIIADAELIASSCLTAAGASDALETSVVKWLAAHLVASTSGNGTLTSRKLGDASKSYASTSLGDGLMGTAYGQQAVALLPCLATIGRAQAVIEVI